MRYKLPQIVPSVVRESLIQDEGEKRRERMDAPHKVVCVFRQIFAAEGFDENKEHLLVFPLNTALKLIGYNIVSIGTINESLAAPREIMRPVLVAGAYRFILAHNHPSGNSDPSEADRRITARIVECANLFQIGLTDHIVIGEESEYSRGFFSFREAGLIPY